MDEKVTREEFEQQKRWYEEMLKQKDEEIDRLKKENLALVKSALKRAELDVRDMPEGERKFFGKGYERSFDH